MHYQLLRLEGKPRRKKLDGNKGWIDSNVQRPWVGDKPCSNSPSHTAQHSSTILFMLSGQAYALWLYGGRNEHNFNFKTV